jgi:hypothetical protein
MPAKCPSSQTCRIPPEQTSASAFFARLRIHNQSIAVSGVDLDHRAILQLDPVIELQHVSFLILRRNFTKQMLKCVGKRWQRCAVRLCR